MAKYGDVAIAAVRLVREEGLDPPSAWAACCAHVFPQGEASRNKGCPRGAFLGLCEEGLVCGVSSGSFTKSILDKKYALDAVAIIRNNPTLANDPDRLWAMIMNGIQKQQNCQLEVVISLWRNGLIEPR